MEGFLIFCTTVNSICALDTYFTCKSVTFILIWSLSFLISFHVSASIAGAVVNAAAVLNMVIGAINKMSVTNPNLVTIQAFKKFCILLKAKF